MKNVLALLFFLIGSQFSFAQYTSLSSQASIHVITVGPYQGELYSAFGHSGFRVVDPAQGIDDFYNYGVFDFNQPNFYLNFARGYLNYRLAVMDYPRVHAYYSYQNRYIHEQVLNLNPAQKQQLFEYLQWNAQPENMFYYYDYFYDNCATRIRDAVIATFGDSVRFDGSYIQTDYTIRDLTDLYLQEQPWGDLGIDICLGLPMDRKASPFIYMFLPDYIESAFSHAFIHTDGKEIPLVKETLITHNATAQPSAASFLTPTLVFWSITALLILITFLGYKRNQYKKWIDVTLFSLIGLLGWLLLLLWVATDHKAAATNLNLLWALPFHFPAALFLLKSKVPKELGYYFLFTAGFGVLILMVWAILPQDLHTSLLPITLLLAIRSYFIYYTIRPA